MRNLRGADFAGILLAACMGFAHPAHAACSGPKDLVGPMMAHPNAPAAMMLGSWFASHQQFGCAVETFRAGLKVEPRSVRLHYLLGLSLYSASQPAEAIAEVRKSIDLDPNISEAHSLLAAMYEAGGRADDAQAEWRKAVALDPSSEHALEALTANLMKRADYAGVVEVLRAAPRSERLTIALARALGMLKYPEEAEAVLKEGIKANPESIPLQQAMLTVLVKEGRHEDAIRTAKAILAQRPNDVDAQRVVFRLLVLTQHEDEARPLGTKLLQMRPDDPEIVFLNGLVERSAGNLEQSKEYLERAVALQPEDVSSRFELGSTLVGLKEWSEAKEQLDRAIVLGADQPEAHFLLSRALRGLGDNDRAQMEMNKYQEIHKHFQSQMEASEAVAQGDSALEAGKGAEAIGYYREAIKQQPNNATFHFKLAVALNESGDGQGERKELEQAIAIDRRLPGPQNAMGVLLARTGDAGGAIEHFRAAVASAPNWVDAWINLGAELAETSHLSDARKAVDHALSLDPQNARARELSDQITRNSRAQAVHP